MIDPLVFIVVLVGVLAVGAYAGWKQHEREQPQWVYIRIHVDEVSFMRFSLAIEEAKRSLKQLEEALVKAMGVPGDYWE